MNNYRANRTLPYRIEFIRQLKRRRTVVSYGLMVALPLIVVAAVKFGPQSGSTGSGGGSNFGSGNLNLIGLNFAITSNCDCNIYLLAQLIA